MKRLHYAVYVTGSIAACKALVLVRRLIEKHNSVRVIMTKAATRFIQPLSFRVFSCHQVVTDEYQPPCSGILHVDLARWTDVAIVIPATANVIAKIANGIADDVVTTCLLTTTAPKIVVPAMNNRMFSNFATQRNLDWLRCERGYWVLGPVDGRLAEGTSGKGRMLEPRQVIHQLERLSEMNHPLTGRRILVTAGGTQEPLDPVRVLTNRSSGKMGLAVAQVALKMGAKVSLICGRTTVPFPTYFHAQQVETTDDMARAVTKVFPKCDALVMTAALADFKPAQIADQKIKKRGRTGLTIKLRKTVDVLDKVAKLKRPDQVTVGFAAETQDLLQNALRKLRHKRLDLMVANDVTSSRIGFGSDVDQVTFLRPRGRSIRTPVESKTRVAQQLLIMVNKRLRSKKNGKEV